MAIKIGSNFAYNGKLPNFERDSFETKAAMKAFDENSIDEGHLSYCKEDGNIYQYKSANTVDTTTGKWRLFKTEADAALNGTSTNPIQNKAVFDALKLKANNETFNYYQYKYNADYVAKGDLDKLPINEGTIDLNGYTLTMSNVENADGKLTIVNGTIKFPELTKILVSTFTLSNINIIDTLDSNKRIKLSVNNLVLNNVISNSKTAFNIWTDGTSNVAPDVVKVYNSSIAGVIAGYTMYLYQSAVSLIIPDDNHGIKLFAFNSFFNDEGAWLEYGSEWYNCYNGFSWITSGCLNEEGKEENYNRFVSSIEQIYKDSENAPQTKAVYNALQLKADATALAAYQPKYKADYIAKADFNYSDLPADAEVIDLNGYTMTINDSEVGTFATSCINGKIQINVNGIGIDSYTITNTNIDVDSNITFDIIEPILYNCKISNAIIADSAAEFYNCELYDCTFDTVPLMYNCIIIRPKITAGTVNDAYYMRNVIIDGAPYKQPVIENNKFVEAGFEADIDNPTIQGNAPSCEAIVTKFNNYATKTELNSKADASALNNYVTTATANSTYAKKSDISNVYKFKGTKTNYADLPTTDRVTGDVWNITNADAEHGIKAGDNVAWNGTEWDNLSGTVDLSAYATTATTDAMSADIKKLMDKAFPFTVEVSLDNTLAKKGTSQPVTLTINAKKGDNVTQVDEININGTKYTGEIPYTHSATATTTTTYNVTVKKGSQTASKSVKITFVNPSYDGAVAANFTATEANIKALTETLRSGKGGTRTFNLNNQKACIAYPKAFGAATGIKDANGFDYLASYTRSELNVNGEAYYVYLMTNATTITDMKQTVS